MHIITTRESLKEYLKIQSELGISIGFVPTMGALHEGHLELIKKAKIENDKVVCSIFVNSLQFNNQEDFDKYPITIESDENKLVSEGCDVLFLPTRKEVFVEEPNLDYDFGQMAEVMEGEYRPGHFLGMAAVVEAFFNLIKPTRSYFGEKDYQQLAIVKKLVKEKKISTDIIACATVRNSKGLALSSRNLRLTKQEVLVASELYQAMSYCKENKQLQPNELISQTIEKLKSNFDIEYFVIADENSLKPIDKWAETDVPRAFVAANLSGVRLIDNMSLID